MDLRSDRIRIGSRSAVVHEHHVADRFKGLHEWPDQASHRVVEKDDLVGGVVDNVGELLGEQPDVQRVGDAAGARWGKVELKVT